MSEARNIIEADPTDLAEKPLERALLKQAMIKGAAQKSEQKGEAYRKFERKLLALKQLQKQIYEQIYFLKDEEVCNLNGYDLLQKNSNILSEYCNALLLQAAEKYLFVSEEAKKNITSVVDDYSKFLKKIFNDLSSPYAEDPDEYFKSFRTFNSRLNEIKETATIIPNYAAMEAGLEYPVDYEGKQYILKLKNHDAFYQTSYGYKQYCYEITHQVSNSASPVGRGGSSKVYMLDGKVIFDDDSADADIEYHAYDLDDPYLYKIFISPFLTREGQKTLRIYHPHSKPEENIASRSRIVMKAFPGQRPSDLDKSSQFELVHKVQLILKALYAYKMQVSDYDIRHLDVKDENILAIADNSKNITKLNFIDYAFLKHNTNIKPHKPKGTPWFKAPEFYNKKMSGKGEIVIISSAKSDIYSLGIMFSRIFTVEMDKVYPHHPIKNSEQLDKDYTQNVLASLKQKLKLYDSKFSEFANDFHSIISFMLQKNPHQRCDIDTCIKKFEELDLKLQKSLNPTLNSEFIEIAYEKGITDRKQLNAIRLKYQQSILKLNNSTEQQDLSEIIAGMLGKLQVGKESATEIANTINDSLKAISNINANAYLRTLNVDTLFGCKTEAEIRDKVVDKIYSQYQVHCDRLIKMLKQIKDISSQHQAAFQNNHETRKLMHTLQRTMAKMNKYEMTLDDLQVLNKKWNKAIPVFEERLKKLTDLLAINKSVNAIHVK